jgi:hypothetical protein
MMQARYVVAFVLTLLVAEPGTTRAAVVADNFQLRTTSDLVALCATDQGDPMLTAAAGFCEGYMVGVYQAMQEVQAGLQTKLFCLPTPAPSRTEAINAFVAWARTTPAAQTEAPADSILRFLNQRFPCAATR